MKKWYELAKARMKETGITQEKLAEHIGVSQGGVAHWLSGRREPSLEVIGQVLKFLGLPEMSVGRGTDAGLFEDGSNVEPGPPITTAARRIDIMGTAQMGPDGHWVGLDDAGGWVETWSRDTDAYALLLRGDSMAPAIRSGWVAVCEPNHRLVPGEYVMVTTTDGQSMVKELLFQNDTGVSLMSINAAYERRTIPWTEIETIHYVGAILGPSKVLGRI
jgi:SOS-response transcriptional repressor LexA